VTVEGGRQVQPRQGRPQNGQVGHGLDTQQAGCAGVHSSRLRTAAFPENHPEHERTGGESGPPADDQGWADEGRCALPLKARRSDSLSRPFLMATGPVPIIRPLYPSADAAAASIFSTASPCEVFPMSQPDPRAVLSQIHRLAGTQTPDEIPDRELLGRFRGRRDEAAFAALVRRYGPMVWGVCRRVLGDRHDAEDAFQAAFLVLAGKADSLRRAESLGAWLHRVARHLALRARGCRDRRQQVETARPPNSSVTPSAGAEPSEELSLREALTILDEEVGRLPEKFRAPVVLCYLQGRTNEEAARELGYAAGTLKWRLGRARDLLGGRLSGRGVSLPAGAAAVLLVAGVSQAAVPASARAALAYSVHQTNGVAAGAARLAQELMRGMTMNRVKLW